jgi:hypothetical protein
MHASPVSGCYCNKCQAARLAQSHNEIGCNCARCIERRGLVLEDSFIEYITLLGLHQVETLGEIDQNDIWPCCDDTTNEDSERTFAWSYAFERNDEHRHEMEWQDAAGYT